MPRVVRDERLRELRESGFVVPDLEVITTATKAPQAKEDPLPQLFVDLRETLDTLVKSQEDSKKLLGLIQRKDANKYSERFHRAIEQSNRIAALNIQALNDLLIAIKEMSSARQTTKKEFNVEVIPGSEQRNKKYVIKQIN